MAMNEWKYTGELRIHFNKPDEFPLLASITPADHAWEVIAKGVVITSGVSLVSSHDLDARKGLDPIWWLSTYASVMLGADGVATVYPATE